MLKILLFSLLLWTVESSQILGIFPTPDVNHFILGSRLLKALAEKGHQVTMISPFTLEEQHKNLTSIEIRQEIELETVNRFTSNFVDQIDMNFISKTTQLYQTAYESTDALLSDRNFQYLLQSGNKYDIIIAEYFMNEALLGVSSYFNAPLVLLSPLPSSSLMNELFANPTPSAYIPNILTGHTGTMSYGERLHNFFCDIFNKNYKYFSALPRQEKLLQKYIKEGSSLKDAINNISLVLLNSHSSITEPVPHTSNMVEIGGMHITNPKPLPEDVEKFIRSASKLAQKVVYFALHSDLKSSNLGKEKVVDILRALGRLQSLRVVWNLKVDEDIGTVPENILIVEDIPHVDMIGQQNVVVVITDGNLFRIMEAVSFEKPIIGVPLIADQKSNIARAVQHGYGIEIPYHELSGQKLHQAIQEILAGQYSSNVAKISKLFKDHLVSPLNTAIYWVEYVIRNGETKHLQSPGVQLPIFKRHLVDIIILLTVIDIILFLIFYYIFKHIIHVAKRKYKERRCKKYAPLDDGLDK